MASYEQPTEKYPLTAFGELSVAQSHPVIQISAQYGQLDKVESFTENSATTSVTGGLFTVNSGTNSAGYSSLKSVRHLTYHAGEGGECKFTAGFTQGVIDSEQFSGLFNGGDKIGFGWKGATFGIIYKSGGEVEIQSLQVTGAAGGSENATVTVDGTAYTVPLTTGTVQHNAFEIAQSLTSQYDGAYFTSNDDTVTYVDKRAKSNGSFAFSSGTATGTWSQVTAATVPTDNFVAQSDWNRDTMSWLNTTNGTLNVYEVDFQYLGAGGIAFNVEDPGSRRFELCHIIEYANANTTPSFRNPSFRVGWQSGNSGNTSNLTVTGASGEASVQGEYTLTELPRGKSYNKTGVGTSYTGVLSIRCRTNLNGIENLSESFIRSISLGTDGTKGAVFEIRQNGTPTDSWDFGYVDESNSIMEFAENGGAVSGGRVLSEFVVGATGGIVVSGEDLKQWIHPGEVITISAKVVSGSAAAMVVAMTWQEDL